VTAVFSAVRSPVISAARPAFRFAGGLDPSLDLNFLSPFSLAAAGITFTRASGATYYDATGTMQTAATNAPRFDYDPVTLAPRGLLIEEQRTNFIRNGSATGASPGAPGTLPTNWLQAASSGLQPFVIGTGTESGIPYIDLQFNGTASAGVSSVYPENATTIAALTGQAWGQSTYIRLVSGSLTNVSKIELAIQEETSAGGFINLATSGALAVTSAALSGQRYAFLNTLNGGATTAFLQPQLRITFLAGAVSFTLRIGGWQQEAGAFATSYIPTTTAAATRAADSATMPVGPWYNPNAGTLAVSWILEGRNGTYASPVQFVGSNTGTDYISVDELTGGTPTAPLWLSSAVTVAGAITNAAGNAAVMNAGTALKGATSWAVGSPVNGAHKGVLATPSAGNLAATPVIQNLTFAGTMHYQNPPSIWLGRVRYWPRAQPAAELQGSAQ
jgi:hypothetical protein